MARNAIGPLVAEQFTACGANEFLLLSLSFVATLRTWDVHFWAAEHIQPTEQSR